MAWSSRKNHCDPRSASTGRLAAPVIVALPGGEGTPPVHAARVVQSAMLSATQEMRGRTMMLKAATVGAVEGTFRGFFLGALVVAGCVVIGLWAVCG